MEDAAPVVLIVEDEWLTRHDLARELQRAGWTVLEAPSGDDALAYLRNRVAIHALITDIQLGGSVSGGMSQKTSAPPIRTSRSSTFPATGTRSRGWWPAVCSSTSRTARPNYRRPAASSAAPAIPPCRPSRREQGRQIGITRSHSRAIEIQRRQQPAMNRTGSDPAIRFISV